MLNYPPASRKITKFEKRFSFRLLSDKQLDIIHTSTLNILEKVGVKIPVPQIYEILNEAGAQVDIKNGRVKFPSTLVEESLRKAPPNFYLYARNREFDINLDGEHSYLSLDGCASTIRDLDSGQSRSSTKHDLEKAIKVADYLPQISFVWPCVAAGDCSEEIQSLIELAVMLKNTDKHIQAMTVVNKLNAEGAVELAAVVTEGKENLKKRPIISNFQCSVSPLAYDRNSLEAAMVFAESGIPTGFMSMQVGGSTAPITLVGNLVQGNVEILAGIIFLQILYPGLPTFYGSCSTVIDPRTGHVSCSGPEDFFLQMASAELARYYHLPSSIGTMAHSERNINYFSGVSNAISAFSSMLAGADMMCGAGLMASAKEFSYEQLILDAEIYEIISKTITLPNFSKEEIAEDVISKVHNKGHYLSDRHTRMFYKNLWSSKIFPRFEISGELEYSEKAKAREFVEWILKNHEIKPLSTQQINQLDEIINYYENIIKGGRA